MYPSSSLRLDAIPLSAEKPPNPHYDDDLSYNGSYYGDANAMDDDMHHVRYGNHVVERLDIEEIARPAPKPIPYPARLTPPLQTKAMPTKNDKRQVEVKITRHTDNQPSVSAPKNYGNPERVKYLMKAGHHQRRTEDNRDEFGEIERRTPPLSKPAYHSTAKIQSQINQLQAQTFEEDEEAQQEVQRRVKLEAKTNKKINYEPTERRFNNLVPLEAGEGVPASVVARKVPKQVTQQYLKAKEAKPDIMDLYDYSKLQPEFCSTHSVYVPPTTTATINSDSRHSSFFAKQQQYFEKGLTPDDVLHTSK